MCEMIPSWQLRPSVQPHTYHVEDTTKDRITALEVMVAKLNATVAGLTESLKVEEVE